MLKVLKKDMICASLLILNGIFLLVCPILSWTNFVILFVGTFVFYAIVNAIKFFLDMKNYLSSLTCLSCLLIGIISLVFPVIDTPKYLAITLLVFTMFLSLIKLKKADIYHDNRSKLWALQIASLVLFVISGILTSINFLYGVETQILVFGYFIFITGIFEFIDSFIAYLTKGKVR